MCVAGCREVRDGFLGVVFPLLLRRQDLRVSVFARQRRLVSSDLRLTLETVETTHTSTTSSSSTTGSAQ